MNEHLIAVDVGTQGTKAALLDRSLTPLHTAFVPSNLISPEPGVVWQEPEEMLAECLGAIGQLMAQSGVAPDSVAGIALDGQMAGIMGIGADGQATTPYDSWLDMRCGPQMERMNQIAGKRIIELSGGPATYVHGPKILWWKENHPEAYHKTAKFVLPHAYLTGRLCGLDSEAAYFDYTHLHFSCLSDNRNLAWSEELLGTFDISPDKMARIVSPFEVVGKLTAPMAERCGLVAGIPMVAGCGDTAASTFGTGMFEKGMLLDIAGTASVLCGVTDRYVPDTDNATMVMMRSPVEGLFLPLAYINGGGLCLRWVRNQLTGQPHAEYEALEEEAARIPAGSEGLVFVPHFSGRVLPSNPHMKGSFLGLDFNHTRAHLYRAVMEGIAYEYAYYLRVIRELRPEEAWQQVLVVGGGAQSPLFNQIKADVLGVKASTLMTGETALIGSGAIAGVGVGLLPDYAQPIKAAISEKRRFAPDQSRHAAYRPYREAYLAALQHTSDYYRGHPLTGGMDSR